MAGIQLSSGNFDTGRQCTVILIGPYGRIDLPNVVGFGAKQKIKEIDVDRLDGKQLTAKLPKGWTGQFDLERGSQSVDDAFVAIEAGWFSSGAMGQATVYQYVDEADGSTSCYQFTDASVALVDAGDWKGDSSVRQRVEFRAGQRVKVSA